MDRRRVRTHKDLIVWQKAMGLTVSVHQATLGFPRSEMFGLASQMRRASVSVSSNIAEGSARSSTREFIYFLRIARGSLAEIQTQLELAFHIGYIADASFCRLNADIEEIGRLLNALLAGLRRRLGLLGPRGQSSELSDQRKSPESIDQSPARKWRRHQASTPL